MVRSAYLTLNRSLTDMLTSTISPPAPSPCKVRPAISIGKLTASAATRLPTMKIELAMINIGFLPKMSLIFPQKGTAAALPRRYADPIQEKSEPEASKCSAMVGNAVVMIVVSRAARKMVIHSADMSRTSWLLRRSSGGVGDGEVAVAVT